MDPRRLRIPILLGLLLDGVASYAQPNRIVGSIDGSQRVALPGNAPFQGQPQYDSGPVDPSFPMTYVTLSTKPTAGQQKALAQLLADQQDRSSAKYHQWLTPEQYADSFGLNAADMEKIANWLQSEGFTIRYKARGRNWIAFGGTAGQIAKTFGTEIHQYVVDGERHFANATDPSIPGALAGVVTGLRGLNDFHPKPSGSRHGAGRLGPAYTGTSNFVNYLAPGDIATIYDLGPLYNEGIDGAGQVVVVVGQSDIYAGDIAAFRSAFGLPAQAQQYGPTCSVGTLCMILTGDDPGYGVLNDTLEEADLDLEWTGAVARSATITYAYSTDAFTSAYYAIDNRLGPIISMSYGYCEADYQKYVGSLDYAQSEAQKANSVGITWLASSGDTGAGGCDSTSPPSSQAARGLAVEAPASIPEVTAVGGTEFNENGGSYWNYFSGANGGTAISYIPEMAWNDTPDGTGLGSILAASGGGVSAYFAAPAWQAGLGFPDGGGRDVPDVALSASPDHDPYIICYNNASCFDSFEDPNNSIGGTSASTPVFAGILALLNQYLVSSGVQAQAGLGNVNPMLYSLAQNNPLAFHGMTAPFLSNIVPCQGTLDCANGSFGYNAGSGYNLVTGLGSVDGFEFVTSWSGPSQPQITSMSPFTVAESSQNQTITVFGNGFQANLTVTVFSPNNASSTILTGAGLIQNVTPNSFQMVVGFNASGTWGIQVNNPDGLMSNEFGIFVSPPSGTLALPDLVVTSLTGPNSGNPGGVIAMSTKVTNQGSASGGAYRLEFYFSPTSSPSLSTAVDSGWFCSMSSLAAGASQSCSGSVAVPAILTPGTWYLAALADSNNQVVESNEGNNWRVADTGPVTLGPALSILGAASDGNLYSIVPIAGATTLIGPLPDLMSDIAAYNGSLYGISFAVPGSNSVLYAIDPNSGAGTAIGSDTGANLNALVFSSGGTLYAAGGDGLYTIDTNTGYATLVGGGSGNGAYLSSGDLMFDFAGTLYLTSFDGSEDQLFSLDPATGQGTLIGNIGFLSVYGLTYYNGTAYGFTLNGQVITIDLTTGAGTAIASYSPGFYGTTVFAPFSGGAGTSGLRFISMPPCRVVDTRDSTKPSGFGPPSLSAGGTRSFSIPNGTCGIPAAAQAYSLNVTVVPDGPLSYITVWPTGQSQPFVSTLNSLDGEVQANAAIVPGGTGGAISVFATNNTNLVLDINGYFVPNTVANGLGFYPMTPCRLVDTRPGAPSTILHGELAGGTYSILPILSSSCNVPATAQAYSLNFTLVPPGPVSYLTVYPTGESLPIVSTMNDPTGTVEANAAIAPAGSGGDINVYVTQTTNLVVDINGYFAPVGAGALSLYALPPCRVLDTRAPTGSPPFEGAINVNVIGSGCGGTSAAQAYVFNATVVPEGPLGYLTLWPQGIVQPVVSTLNAENGDITSNMAIVPTSNTQISAFASNTTYLVLDLFGYFAP